MRLSQSVLLCVLTCVHNNNRITFGHCLDDRKILAWQWYAFSYHHFYSQEMSSLSCSHFLTDNSTLFFTSGLPKPNSLQEKQNTHTRNRIRVHLNALYWYFLLSKPTTANKRDLGISCIAKSKLLVHLIYVKDLLASFNNSVKDFSNLLGKVLINTISNFVSPAPLSVLISFDIDWKNVLC